MVDIHQYDKQYMKAEQQVIAARISTRNRDLILGYRDACLLHSVCGTVRLIRVFDVLVRCATIVNQETGQLPAELLKALHSIPNIFLFGLNWPDAKQLASLFNGQVSPETLASQPTGSVYAKIAGEMVNFQSPPPQTPNPAVAEGTIADSRQKYHTQDSKHVPASPRRKPRIIETFSEES